jgi:hypothetical protein
LRNLGSGNPVSKAFFVLPKEMSALCLSLFCSGRRENFGTAERQLEVNKEGFFRGASVPVNFLQVEVLAVLEARVTAHRRNLQKTFSLGSVFRSQ